MYYMGYDPFGAYRRSRGYVDVAPGSEAEFEAFDMADFDRLNVAGSQGYAPLSFGEKLMLGSSGMGQNMAGNYMNAGMQPPPLINAGLPGLMNMVGQGGQRPYGPEVAPSAPMPSMVARLLQRGLMG